MAYRNDLEALAARHAALATQAADLAEKRDEAARMLEEARAKARLPILDNLRVASPCSEKWADMTGDGRVRECAKCDKQVFNLSSLTRDEAEALVREKHGKLCVRYFQRADGTIMLADCDIGRRRKRVARIAAAAAVATLAGGVAATYLLRSSPHEGRHVVGEMVGVATPPVSEVSEVSEVAGGASFEPQVPIVAPPAQTATPTPTQTQTKTPTKTATPTRPAKREHLKSQR